MPQIELLADLVNDALQRANLEKSKLVSNAEATKLLKIEIAHTYDFMIEHGAADQWIAVANLAFPKGTQPVALPADYYTLKAAIRQQAGRSYPLPSFDFQDLPELLNRAASAPLYDDPSYRYRIVGTQSDGASLPLQSLWIQPTPAADFTVAVFYYPVISFIPGGAGAVVQLDGINFWLEDAVVGAAIAMLLKQESDVSEHRARRAEIRDRIKGLSAQRDNYQQSGVVDTRRADALAGWWR